ncbi:MAG: hypothetical protein AB8B85_12590 [Paracoccaceae bacterium]
MKAFLAAVVAMVVITIGADLALDQAGFSAEERFSKRDVRLGE